ncbi:hydroxypyruvate isomerase family protein [Chloroflexota bacterium]
MSAEKPRRIKQSLCWGRFTRSTPPEQVLQEALSLGIMGVELVPQDQWDMFLENGLTIVGIGAHSHDRFMNGLNRRENHDKIEKELRDNIEVAAQYKIRNLVCIAGSRGEMSDEEGAANTAECLLRVAKLAENNNVTLSIELLNSKVDHPDNMADHTAWGVSVCKMVNSPAVKLLYDIYHMQIMEGDLIQTIRDNIDYISHFHIAGVPGRGNIDDTQEINYRAVMKAIVDTGYDGFVGHEYNPSGDAMKVLRQAFEICDV